MTDYPNLSGHFRGSFWSESGGGGGGGVGAGGKITPRLKLVRVMLQTLILTHKYTHQCSFRTYTV